MEKVFQFMDQRDAIQQGAPCVHPHKQVDVAFRSDLAAHQGAEQAHLTRAMPLSRPADLVTVMQYVLQGCHRFPALPEELSFYPVGRWQSRRLRTGTGVGLGA
jgi:hypothetical protein